MSPCYLILDQGGHSTRVLLYEADGTLLFASQHSVDIHNPKQNIYQQDIPALLQSINDCLHSIPANNWQIDSAALITQRSSFVACNKQSLDAITPLISWQDTRNQQWLQQQMDHEGFDVHALKALTGLRLNAHYGASKMRWLLDHDKKVQQAHQQNDLLFLPLACFVAAHITHVKTNAKTPVCDAVSAARTFLTEQGTLQWSDALLTLFAIDKTCLPQLVPTEYAYGTVPINHQQVPLTVVGGDQSFIPYAYGLNAIPHTLFINAGTGAFVQCALAKEECPAALLSSAATISHNSSNNNEATLTVAEGTVNACASALDWLWQQPSQQQPQQQAHPLSHQQIEQALCDIDQPPIFYHRITALGSPYWLPAGESSFSADATLEQQAVAVIESVLFLLAINIDLLKLAKPDLQQIAISGGMAKLNGFCQKLATLCELPVVRHHDHEASARGALFYLTRQTDYHPLEAPDVFSPQTDRALLARYQHFYEWLRQEWLASQK